MVGINVKYSIFKHVIEIEGKQVETYGIAVQSGGETERIVFDVSENGVAVELLVESLNEGEVEPIHLDGILENFFDLNP